MVPRLNPFLLASFCVLSHIGAGLSHSGAGLRAAEGDGYVKKIESSAELERLSIPERFLPGVDRTLKFLVPVREDPALLPTLFQNVNKYDFHHAFLVGEFPDRFPGLTSTEYLNLVEKRATRSYYAGVFFRFEGNPDPTYGFDLFTIAGNRDELPRKEEVEWVHQHLVPAFTLGTISYAPRNQDAIKIALGWVNPSFPINFSFGDGSITYIAYTRAENYGRVRSLTPEQFDDANENGGFGFQDILILGQVPTDIEGVIAGVITGEFQGELGHLAIRTARRGTPNAFVKDSFEAFKQYEGKLVRLSIESAGYTVTEATLAEAEAWWDTHRPKTPEIVEVDPDHSSFDSTADISITNDETYIAALKRYGGKATNGAILYSLLPAEHRVKGFAIPYHHYLEFIRSNKTLSPIDPSREVTYEKYIEELITDPRFRGDSQRRFDELAKLRELFEDKGVANPSTVRAVALRVVEIFGTANEKVRFRSSGNAEHILEFNGAGLHTSVSGCPADDLDAGTSGPSRCDTSEAGERGVGRAMKRVWGSLWNFRAFEEREYFRIPHLKCRMGVFVSEAFTGVDEELVNGVAFSGNLDVPGDRRFVINSQIGDTPVVSPPPGVVSEKAVLEIANGQVSSILRVRPSSLAQTGEIVLNDAYLRSIGQVLDDVEKRYPVGLGTHERNEVLIDLEFKVDTKGVLRYKDVRQFLISTTAEPPLEFKLKIPAGMVACAGFAEGRAPQKVLELKAHLGLRAGEYVGRADGATASDIFEWFQFGEDAPRLTPLGQGLWTATPIHDPAPGFRFGLTQEFRTPTGELIHVSLKNLFVASGGPKEVDLKAEDLAWAINQYFLHLEFSFPDDPPDAYRDTWFLPCDMSSLPIHKVDVLLSTGDTFRFQEHFQDVLDGTGPAEVLTAEISLGGQKQTINDYWRLAYTAGHHNDHPYPELWAILEPAIDLPGVGRVKAVVSRQNGINEDPEAFLLGEDLQQLTEMEIIMLRRQRVGTPEIPQFRRGDANGSGTVNITDVITILLYQFSAGELVCPDAADFDDIGSIDLDDAVLLLQYLFFNLDPPAFPGPRHCGRDPVGSNQEELDDLSPCEGAGCRL